MNGKNILHSFDLDDHHVFDEEIDTITELDRDPIVSDVKDLFDLETDAEFVQFVRHANPAGPLQQPWPQFGMNSIGSAQDVVCNVPMSQMSYVTSARVRVLRGSAFDRCSACDTQRMGRLS